MVSKVRCSLEDTCRFHSVEKIKSTKSWYSSWQAAGALQILDASRLVPCTRDLLLSRTCLVLSSKALGTGHRTTLGQLTTDQALVLLDCLHRVKGEQAESQSVAACFYLLARWCRNNHTEIDTGQGAELGSACLKASPLYCTKPSCSHCLRADVDSTMCLTDGVRTGLAIAGNPDKTPEMSCAICLFLSSAAAGK